MPLRIYNSLTRKKEDFVPLHEGSVGMYVCGPTVYDHAHIGHAKSYISFDVVVRYLRYLGYKVRYVQNITDVGHLTDNADAGEDKIEKRAAQSRLEPMELVETYMRSYFEDMDALNVLRPDISPRPSGHITEEIELVKTLVDKGYAYEVDGSVYFSVEKFAEYGKLSRRSFEEQEEGARVEVIQAKQHPGDFALWKRAEPGHILRWPSPWGEGFPGWHLECSVMSMKYLGETFDIHGGGLENIFPHHEDEIAQSEAATGKPFVRYWMHNNMVLVNGARMGKSLGNFATVKEALKKHYPEAIRLFVLSSHYRSPSDFTEEALEGADRGVARLFEAVRTVRAKLRTETGDGVDPALQRQMDAHKAAFLSAMDDDFNTAGALASLFDLARETNALAHAAQPVSRATWAHAAATYDELAGDVLGLLSPRSELREATARQTEERLVELLLDTRQRLRDAKQWELADEIRKQLKDLGFVLKDSAEGTTWQQEKGSPPTSDESE